MDEDYKFQWDQFEKLIDLHKFYFENLIKSATFSFGIVGAIFTYVIKTNLSIELIRLSLLLPLLLSGGTCLMFFYGIKLARSFSDSVEKMQKTNLGIAWRPHAEILPEMCKLFSILFLIVSIGFLIVILHPSILNLSKATA